MRTIVLVASMLAVSFATPAMAQRKAAAKPPAAITVNNARTSTLTELVLSTADGKVVARLAQPLAGGKKATVKLTKGATCALEVSATFEDESENAGTQVDVCKDKSLRFGD